MELVDIAETCGVSLATVKRRLEPALAQTTELSKSVAGAASWKSTFDGAALAACYPVTRTGANVVVRIEVNQTPGDPVWANGSSLQQGSGGRPLHPRELDSRSS
jgi:hypothetical protein